MSLRPREDESIVYIVDDDSSIREALASLMSLIGLKTECFASAQEFLKKKLPDVASCLVLDVRLPGISGLNVQTDLSKAGIDIPIIFMTAHGDIPMTVQAMKAGAVEFLAKPFRDQEMIDAVQLALEKDRTRRQRDYAQADLRDKFASLTERERQVMEFVAAGLMNKQVAGKMGLAEITVKIHRGNAVRKMGAKSLADLVKMAQILGVTSEKS
jgi:FixJ family two-component response regulator